MDVITVNKWKVAAYVRLSSEDDNDKSNSIMNQIEIVDKYLENKINYKKRKNNYKKHS